MAKLLCETIVHQVVPVSSARAAEPVKILENTSRAVNIALANEIATIPDKLDVDVWEAQSMQQVRWSLESGLT